MVILISFFNFELCFETYGKRALLKFYVAVTLKNLFQVQYQYIIKTNTKLKTTTTTTAIQITTLMKVICITVKVSLLQANPYFN